MGLSLLHDGNHFIRKEGVPMNLQKTRERIGRFVSVVNYAAMLPLFLMAFVVAIDVILRKAQMGRVNGSNELTTYFLVWICMLGIPVLQFKDGHVWVSLFVNKFPYRFRCFLRFGIMVFETAVIGLLAYGGYVKVMSFYTKTTTTDVLNIPKWIFALAALVAFVEYFLLSLIDTVQFCVDGVKNEKREVADESWTDDQVKGI
jgi:TRAP-type C4-dicarboxylate transport system permease small subunit